MTTVPRLGPRAAYLLGMLWQPKTAAELHERIGKGLDMPELIDILEEVSGDETIAELRALHDGGTKEIIRHLVRLEELGFVWCAGDELWFRR